MPLYKDLSDENAEIYLWKYEDVDDLDAKKLIEAENEERFKSYQSKKLLEALMVREIISKKLPGYKILYTDTEPYLEPRDFEISISHSFPYAAVAFSKLKIGIDVEALKPKIIRIKDKFIQPEEQEFIPKDLELEYLTVIWSIKESLYKIHHSNYWSLKKHYEVRPFDLNFVEKIECRVHDEQFSDEYTARAFFFDGYVLTIVD